MTDEQGTGEPDGYFARLDLGISVNNILDHVGRSGRRFVPQTEPPANPVNGDTYIADGTNWDVAGSGNAAKVVYLNGDWRVTYEFTGAGGV
jgi:hypothetical protein